MRDKIKTRVLSTWTEAESSQPLESMIAKQKYLVGVVLCRKTLNFCRLFPIKVLEHCVSPPESFSSACRVKARNIVPKTWKKRQC